MKPLVTAFLLSVICYAADQKLGQPLTLKEAMPVATLLAKPDPFVGKTVQVKGKITAVCQDMGCWMELADDKDAKIRIKVEDGVIVFPKSSAGKTAIAEGRFSKQDSGYQIDGTGAIIQGN